MNTFKVTNGNDSGNGSLRSAIALANASPGKDDILVEVDVELNSAINITDSVTIGNPFGATITQIGSDRIFNIDDNNDDLDLDISLYRLNLQGGYSESVGGAISSQENLSIIDSQLVNNTAISGAAVYLENAALYIERTQIKSNQITDITTPSNEDNLQVVNGQLQIANSILEPANIITEALPGLDSPGFLARDTSANFLAGGSGDDIILGVDGLNTLVEADDNDKIDSGAGNDTLVTSWILVGMSTIILAIKIYRLLNLSA